MDTVILGTGNRLGGRTVSSEELEALHGIEPGLLLRESGVASRPMLKQGETQELLAVAAAHLALDDANAAPEDIDLFLFASAVGRQPIPATAALIKAELGVLENAAPAFDINATCLSAVAAMDIAQMYIAAGRARRVLISSSEISSRALPWHTDPGTAALFGDGAGAIILGSADLAPSRPLLRYAAIETHAEGYDLCTLAAGGTRYDFHTDRRAFEENSWFKMNGHELFRLTHKRLPAFISKLLAKIGWRESDIDLVLPHQASPLALAHMVKRCGFKPGSVFSTVRTTGNLVAASLPITLDLARREGRVQPGQKLLMIGTSAGVSFGGALIET